MNVDIRKNTDPIVVGMERVNKRIQICLLLVRKLPERRKRERSMYFHYSPVYSQFILYLYLIYVSIVIIYAE